MSKLDKARSQVLKMKGKTFTITLSNGQKLQGTVHGIKGNQVVFKASHMSSNTQQFRRFRRSFFFLFPLLFFTGLVL